MICPKCKSQNDDNALECANCGFKLKLKCPHCGSYNTIGAKVCSSCNKQLLKLCPICKAVNFSTSKVCRKCSHPFSAKPVVEKTEETIPEELEKAATLVIELINISSIKANVKSEEMAQKVINKFYQVFAKAAKAIGLKALKLNESTLAATFLGSASFPDSVNDGLNLASRLDNELSEISRLIESKLKISYKIRYLLTSMRPQQKKEIAVAASLGVVDDVIFDEEVYGVLKDKVTFAEIDGPDEKKYYKFLNQSAADNIPTQEQQETLIKSRSETISEMMSKIQLEQKGFIACLNGPTGIGKSHIFSALRYAYAEDNSHIWLYGECPLQSPYSPLAYFRSVLQNLFDIPVFNVDIENSKNKVYTYLSEKLNITDEDIVSNILAAIFTDETRLQNAIYENKGKIYKAISTIFRALLSKGSVILQIEDIELIDHFSLEILRSLFNDGILQCDFKIFITSNIDTDIIQFLASPHVTKDNSYFANYPIMTKADIDDAIKKAIGVREELGAPVLNHIYENSHGIPSFVDEFILMILQLGLVRFEQSGDMPVTISPELAKIKYPQTTQEIIQVRLTSISNTNPDAFRALYYASILGNKFLPSIVQNIIKADDNKFTDIIKFLSLNQFIAPFDTYNYVFKNRTVWETIRNLQLSPENRVTGVTSTMKNLVELTVPDMASVIHNLLGVSVPKHDLLSYIEQASKEAYCLGDDTSYIYHKSLLMDAVEVSTLENKETIILAIKEELVRLTYITFPETAIRYADELVVHYEPVDTAKTIDILGLMSVAFEITGNYLAAIECADKALEKIDPADNKLATMMLKYSKINSILSLGRYEELNNLCQNEIFPTIKSYFDSKIKEDTTLRENDIYSILLETKYKYALSLALQGSKQAIDVANELKKEAQSSTNNDYILKANLIEALCCLLEGETEKLNNILESTKNDISSTKEIPQNTFFWLILKNIGDYFKGEYGKIANEFVMLANYAQNIKEHWMEPVIKGFLVKLALIEGNADFAQNLAYEEYYKCANNRWSLGALINWYMYADISIYKDCFEDALKVTQKALDVAEKANTNNLFFTALLKMKLAEIYAIRSDYDMAKINAQEAFQLAEINDYNWIKAKLGIVYYNILIKQTAANPSLKNDNIKLLNKQLLIAEDAVKKICNTELHMLIKQNIEAITNFAEQNGIKLN